MQRRIVMAAAWLEIVVGAIFVVAPDVPCVLLFDSKPEGIGSPLARWIGISLFALGLACLPAKPTEPNRRAVMGLFVFNGGLVVLLVCFGAFGAVHGFLLWPVVALHAIITVMLLPQVLSTKDWWHVASVIDEATTWKPRK